MQKNYCVWKNISQRVKSGVAKEKSNNHISRNWRKFIYRFN